MASHLSATAYELFEAHGFDAVSMEQIADEADVAKATLYNYFPVKEALIAHRFREDIAAGMADRAAELVKHTSFDSRMRYLLRESATWHSERKPYLPHYIRFLTNQASWAPAAASSGDYSGTVQILSHMFQLAQQSGEADSRQSAEQLAVSFQWLLFGAVTGWLSDSRLSLEDRFLAAFDLFLHGIATRAAVR
jgi:AcrR family transcriptional regulator